MTTNWTERGPLSIEDFETHVISNWRRPDGCCDTAQDNQDLLVMCLGLAGEVGEVLEPIKKHVRDSTPLDREALGLELGDVLYYLTRLSHEFGFTLQGLMQKNFDKLANRRAKKLRKAKKDSEALAAKIVSMELSS